MSLDNLIGKAKEVAGKVLDDKELQAEGIVQQGVDTAKQEVAETAEKLKDGADSLIGGLGDKAKGLFGDAKEKVADAVIDAKEKIDEKTDNA